MKTLLLNLFMAVLYIGGGYLSFSFEQTADIVTLAVFIPEGVALGAVLIYGKKIVPGIFFGQFILSFTTGLPLFVSISIALTNSLEALLALYISHKIKLRISPKKPSDIYKLFIMIIFILQPFSAIFGNIALLFGSLITQEHFFMSTITWWFGNVMGQVLVTPMILLLYSSIKRKTLKPLYLFAIITILALIFLFVGFLPLQNMAILMSFTIPFVLLLVGYAGIEYASVGVLIIASFTIFEKMFGINIFLVNSTNNIINLNFFIIAHIVITYTYGILQSQKERALKDVQLLNKSLMQRVKKEVQNSREKDKMLLYKSRLAQMGEMMNMIAHQWRQPLNIISMLHQSMLFKYKKGILDETLFDEFSKKMDEQISYMSQTIDDFRDFFKPEKEKKLFLLNDTIENAMSMVEKSFQKENISLLCSTKIEHAVVLGYQNEFAQVLLNILNNARDVLSHQVKENKTVTITLSKRSDKYELCIEDNGGGIKEEHFEKVFEPYFSTKEQLNGTGLGLYICKIIVEEHMQGELKVKNIQAKEKGAKFCIYLPIEEGIKNSYEK